MRKYESWIKAGSAVYSMALRLELLHLNTSPAQAQTQTQTHIDPDRERERESKSNFSSATRLFNATFLLSDHTMPMCVPS